MRPDRAVVKKAIADAKGNLSRAAALLGCTRQTLYTWIYQLGLERLAGIRLDRQIRLDTRERKDTRDTRTEKTIKSGVYSSPSERPTLRVVAPQAAPVEIPLAATVKLSESLWKRVKIEAIREGCTVSEFVRRSLETTLAESAAGPRRKRADTNGSDSE